jgi:Ca2+-binding RTX toxin-like protein
VNDAPEGVVVIDGLAQIREVLTANSFTISDQDGLGAFSYQWYRDGVAITDATSATYKVAGADIEEDLTVAVSYTDTFGKDETVVSAVVNPEANDPGVTVVVTDGNSDEDGSLATFTVALDSEIKSDVSIEFQVSDATEAELLTSTVTFTPDTWDVAQTVTIMGLDDYDDDGDVSYNVTGVLTTDDLNYVRVPVEPMSFVNTDDGEDTDIQLYGTNAVDYLQGMNGDDRLYGLGNLDDLHGGRGNDRLYGGYDNDRLYGEEGDDELYGEQDDDLLEGGAGDDELYGGGSSDILKGGDGDDILNGGTGVDTMIGGAGNDTYYVDREGDVIQDNGLPDDKDTVIVIGNFTYKLDNGLENASLSDESGSVGLTGNSLGNKLTGNSADNTLKGGGGDDTLYSQGGNDVVLGGNGNDLIIGGSGAGNDT